MYDYIAPFITPILTALVVWFIERDRDKKDSLRDEAEQVNREVNSATMELTYATAVAVKRGKANGEVEAAIDAYNSAKKHQDEFNQKLQQQIIK